MIERITAVMTAIVGAVATVAVLTHPVSRGTFRAIGGTFTGAVGQIVKAAGR